MINKETEEILKRIPHKNYAHFDLRTSMKFSWNYVTNPEKIVHHHFYPFIYYEKDYTKYNKITGIQRTNNEYNRRIMKKLILPTKTFPKCCFFQKLYIFIS